MALDLVASITWPAGSTIQLVEAVATGVAVFGGPWPPVPPTDTTVIEDGIRKQAERNLDAARARLAAPGRAVETSIVVGRAADAVTAVARQSGADIIVIGSRGHGGLESMLLGSVSAEIIDSAPAPVLVARGPGIHRVTYAWDGSTCASRAGRLLVDWGIFSASEILVVSVADIVQPVWSDGDLVDAGTRDAAFDAAAEPSRTQHDQLAHEMAQQLRDAGLTAQPERRDGVPAEQIVSAAEAWNADLIVMGSHGRTGLRRLFMGSVARNVVHHSNRSVLIVREADADAATDQTTGDTARDWPDEATPDSLIYRTDSSVPRYPHPGAG